MSYYDPIYYGKTKKGKKIAYKVFDGESNYSIYFPQGGEVPKELSGKWNDVRMIEIAITSYLNKDKLSEEDQAKKDFRAGVLAAKKRPNKLKHKSA